VQKKTENTASEHANEFVNERVCLDWDVGGNAPNLHAAGTDSETVVFVPGLVVGRVIDSVISLDTVSPWVNMTGWIPRGLASGKLCEVSRVLVVGRESMSQVCMSYVPAPVVP
jgi:hypothetical protein